MSNAYIQNTPASDEFGHAKTPQEAQHHDMTHNFFKSLAETIKEVEGSVTADKIKQIKGSDNIWATMNATLKKLDMVTHHESLMRMKKKKPR